MPLCGRVEYDELTMTAPQPKQKKNIETDIVGDKVGRIHLGKQDLGQLQTRKMRGLKRSRDVDEEEQDDLTMVGVDDDDEPVTRRKKLR